MHHRLEPLQVQDASVCIIIVEELFEHIDEHTPVTIIHDSEKLGQKENEWFIEFHPTINDKYHGEFPSSMDGIANV